MKQIKDLKTVLHFKKDNYVYRYALVEKIDITNINDLTKQKKDEVSLSEEDIWKKYGINSRYL